MLLMKWNQFVLEPLAFTIIKDLSKFHGCAFLEQISYITRTFAFSMHQEYKKILEKIKDNPMLDTLYSNTLLISAHPNKSHCEDPMRLSQALPSQTRPDLSCQQTDHVLGLQAGHCQPGLQQLVCGVPVPSTSAPSTTICNMVQDDNECHHDHCVGVDCGAVWLLVKSVEAFQAV